MASRSRTRPERKKRNPTQFPELGLFDIPNLDALDDSDGGSDVDESALESELEALMSGKAPSKPTRPKPKAKPPVDIERIAADCLKDIEDDNDDEDLSTDEDLLNELQVLTIGQPEETETTPEGNVAEVKETKSEMNKVASTSLSVLQERSTMYKEAIETAKKVADSSKVRRYSRALKTIESLLKSANAGNLINEEDIPPVVLIPKITPPNTSTSVSKPVIELAKSSESKGPTIYTNTDYQAPQTSVEDGTSLLKSRREEYKKAALMAKRSGNMELAAPYLKAVLTIDKVLREAVEKNLPVDLSNLPPSLEGLGEYTTSTTKIAHPPTRLAHDESQTSSNTDMEKAALAAADEAEQPEMFSAPPPPSTILEALEQRLQKYTSTKNVAKAEGNPGKERRLDRIVKQYEKAIKDYKNGKTVDYAELPTPPGFGPIPLTNEKSANPPIKPSEQNKAVPKTSTAAKQTEVANSTVPKKPKVQRSTTSNKQLDFLIERQKLFREAALSAKKSGDIQQAKEYLRMSKGFDNLIEATRCGLPIDATSIPTPPQMETDFVIVDSSECTEHHDKSQEELFQILETDLTHQIEICTRNKEHFLRLGDVSSASKFEKLCLESKKDMAVILHLRNKGESAPRFHYETRLFSVVQCQTDLGDNDFEVTIERGINLPGKPDLDTYVRLEFPIPPEATQRAKTHTIRDSTNPIFQEEFKFEFTRKARSHLRHFKRGFLKLEVWSKGGFLRSDTHLGTVSVKLSDLESKCLVHDSFNLMDGRKACGGKLEVKMRIRDPLLVKQVEEVREKWLVVGS